MTPIASFDIGIDPCSDFVFCRRKIDDPVLIQKADVFDTFLTTDFLNHLVNTIPVVLHHLVIGCPEDCVAEVVRILDRFLQINLLKGVDIQIGKHRHCAQQYDSSGDRKFGCQFVAQTVPPGSLLLCVRWYFLSSWCRKDISLFTAGAVA